MARKDVGSSFRDPSGYVFIEDGTLYRQVNKGYGPEYDLLMDSGLYERLVGLGLLVAHDEEEFDASRFPDAHRLLKPHRVRFLSYPYEWCFSQLKDAALATLAVQSVALEHGMSLKDASAYNIQFEDGRPVLIDTLSFEKWEEGRPWVAYRQFCQHFLAPLALASYMDMRLNLVLSQFIDGVPLDLASKLLPKRSWLNYGILLHIHMHSRSQARYAGAKSQKKAQGMGRNSFLGLVDSLKSTVKSLKWAPDKTVWTDYYGYESNYGQDGTREKAQIVGDLLKKACPREVWDVGANTGLYSRLSSKTGVPTLSFDLDASCVEVNYLKAKEDGERNLLPLVVDVTNPSPGIGWGNRERLPFLERNRADTVLALAIIHHLALGNNLPLPKLADFFAGICEKLIIEFVPKQDSNAQRLLKDKGDIFPGYSRKGFEAEFGRRFKILETEEIPATKRTMYLMERN